MSRQDRIRLLAAAALLVLVAGAARAQGTTPPPQSPGTPTQTSPAAPGEPAGTPEPEWRWRFLSVGGDFYETSAYVWRGWVLHEGACLQPELWVSIGDFTVTSWINLRHDGMGDNRLNERDLTVDYSRDVGRLTLSAGWTNYRFFGLGSGHSNEFYVGARADVLLQPGIHVYHDVEQGAGSYLSLSTGHEWPIVRRITGVAQVALGYNHHQYMTASGFSDLALTLKLSVPAPSARAILQPTLAYSHSLMPETFPSRVFGGLSVAFK